MILKIKDKLYDTNLEPVILEFTETELKLIKENSKYTYKFCFYPKDFGK